MGPATKSHADARIAAPPAWAPRSVAEAIKVSRRRNLSGAAMLERCAVEPIRSVWQRVEAQPPIAGHVAHVDVLPYVLLQAWRGPQGMEMQTNRQRYRFLVEVARHADRLAELLADTPLDFALVPPASAFTPMGLSLAASFEAYRNDVPALSDQLRRLVVALHGFVSWPLMIERPHGASARRAFFVRYLTTWAVWAFGRPQRELVAVFTSAAFGEPIDQRQVRRLAPVASPPRTVSEANRNEGARLFTGESSTYDQLR